VAQLWPQSATGLRVDAAEQLSPPGRTDNHTRPSDLILHRRYELAMNGAPAGA